MMVVVRETPDDESKIGVYVKGAPEEILPLCDKYYTNSFSERAFSRGQ